MTTIVVCAQTINNESKWEWKHSYLSITRGMKSSRGTHLAYDHVFSWVTIIVACVIIVDVHCTISVQIKSTMITFVKVQKPSLVIKISTHCWVWRRKRWKTSFLTHVPFSKAINVAISQSVSWVVVCSLT
jgi:undecaprenyl pyrophosphate phosphatase UppP